MAIGFRTSGMFGRMSPTRFPMGTPGYGDGILQRQTEMEPMNSNPNAMPIGVKEMTKKPGFFQKGGFGQYALAAISDFAARRGGHNQNMLGDVMAFKMQEEDAKIRQQMAEQKRMQDREDKQWEWENKPKEERAPYRWEANDGSLMEVGPDGQPRQVYKDPTPKTTYISVDNGDGTKTVVPVVNGQIMGGGQRPQIGAVIADPRKQGGQAASPPATFR